MKKILTRENLFILLMVLSTFALAGSAAYYSVFGLSSLFAGARFEVIIMAASLEVAKLIVASYLHNNWKTVGWLKWYLSLAVGVLMVITSAGIYGFLTSAYQTTADQLTVVEKQTQVIELKRDRFSESLNGYTTEREQLNESISELTKGLSNNTIQYRDRETGEIITTTSSSTRRVLNSQLDDMKIQRDNVSIKMEALTDSITRLDLKILDLESNNEVAAEIGPLRYMSEITGKPMGVIVNWFTLLIVFVFDPLAIAMVIALNKLTAKNNKDDGNFDNGVDNDTNGNYGNGNISTSNISDGEKVSVLRDEMDKEGTQVGKETDETISKKSEKQDVEFVPTDEEAENLYGEPKPRKKSKLHKYRR